MKRFRSKRSFSRWKMLAIPSAKRLAETRSVSAAIIFATSTKCLRDMVFFLFRRSLEPLEYIRPCPDRQALYMKLTISTARVIPAGTRKTSMKKARLKILANSNSSGILGMHNLTVILLEKQEEIHKTYNAQERGPPRLRGLATLEKR